MDDARNILLLIGVIVAAVATIQQMFAAYNIIFDDIPTKWKRKMRERKENLN
jgi:hypothetical protein